MHTITEGIRTLRARGEGGREGRHREQANANGKVWRKTHAGRASKGIRGEDKERRDSQAGSSTGTAAFL